MNEGTKDLDRGAGWSAEKGGHSRGSLQESASLFQTFFNIAAVGIAVAEVETKRFLLANPAFCSMLGYTGGEIRAMDIGDIHPCEKLPEVLDEFHALARGDKVLAVDIPCRRRDGTLLYTDISASQIIIDNKLCNVGFFSNVTERKRTESQIVQLNDLKERLIGDLSLKQKFALITDSIVGVFGADFARIWQVRAGDLCDKGCIHAVFRQERLTCCDNPRCLHLEASSGRYTHIDGDHRRVPFGSYKIGRIASGEDSRFLTNDVARDPRIHNREWAAGLGLVSFAGFRLLSPQDKPIGVLALFSKRPIVSVEEGLLANLASYVSQVILSEQAREELHNLSIVDELTGLYNRRGFSMLATQQLKLARRQKKHLFLLYVDLDDLKRINDSLGHQEGDAAITAVARILKKSFRKSDIIGRQGGDEFTVLMIDTTEEIDKRQHQLQQNLADYNRSEAGRCQLSLSVGVAHFDPGAPCSLTELIARADRHMYKEKRKK